MISVFKSTEKPCRLSLRTNTMAKMLCGSFMKTSTKSAISANANALLTTKWSIGTAKTTRLPSEMIGITYFWLAVIAMGKSRTFSTTSLILHEVMWKR